MEHLASYFCSTYGGAFFAGAGGLFSKRNGLSSGVEVPVRQRQPS